MSCLLLGVHTKVHVLNFNFPCCSLDIASCFPLGKGSQRWHPALAAAIVPHPGKAGPHVGRDPGQGSHRFPALQWTLDPAPFWEKHTCRLPPEAAEEGHRAPFRSPNAAQGKTSHTTRSQGHLLPPRNLSPLNGLGNPEAPSPSCPTLEQPGKARVASCLFQGPVPGEGSSLTHCRGPSYTGPPKLYTVT